MHSWIDLEGRNIQPATETSFARRPGNAAADTGQAGGGQPLQAVLDAQHELAAIDLDPEAVMHLILEGSRALAGPDGALIEVISQDDIVYRAASGVLGALRGPRSQGSKTFCLTSDDLLICDDAETDFRVDRVACGRMNVRSLISVPLPAGCRVRGKLEVAWSRRDCFDDRIVWGLRLMAGLLASSMSHAIQLEAKQRLLAERMQALTALSHRVRHDPLTGMPNRLCFDDRLAHAIALARRNRKRTAVIALDVDHFKEINDTLGHPAGDVVLQQFSNRLRAQLRESDTLARIGGDEFMIVLPELADAAGAVTVAAKLADSLRRPLPVGAREVQATCSMGIAVYPDHGKDAATLQKRADEQMYVTKRKGRNGYSMEGKD